MDREKIAIPVYTGRISPLFDVAGEFHIYTIENGEITRSHTVNTGGCSELAIINRLRQEGASVVICGAISRCTADVVVSSGMHLIPGVMGCTEEVIDAYIKKSLLPERFAMPGCRGRGMGRRRAQGQCPFYNAGSDDITDKRSS